LRHLVELEPSQPRTDREKPWILASGDPLARMAVTLVHGAELEHRERVSILPDARGVEQNRARTRQFDGKRSQPKERAGDH
jgi:hypothetical protein